MKNPSIYNKMGKKETACATLSDLIDTKKEAEAECLTDIDDSVFIIGCIKDTDHFNWIFRDEEQPYYNIRQGHRHGALLRTPEVKHANYAIMYNVDDKEHFLVYKLKMQHYIWDEDRMSASGYKNPTGKYYIYLLDRQMNTDKLDLSKFINCRISENDKGQPICVSGEEIRSLI